MATFVVVAGPTGQGQLPTVNISANFTGPTGCQTPATQISGASGAGSPGQFKTVQDSGGVVAGLKSLWIPGYVGPA